MMKTTVEINGVSYEIDLNAPYADLSMAVTDIARAWYIDAPKFTPVILGDWKGSVELGGNMNFFFHRLQPTCALYSHRNGRSHFTDETFHKPTLQSTLYPSLGTLSRGH